MIKCLMLDVDGVLVDGRPCDGYRWDIDLEHDLNISPQLLRQHFFSNDWGCVVTGKKRLFDALEERLLQVNVSINIEELVSYWFENDSRIITHVLDDCEKLRRYGMTIYLTTNQEHERARYLMNTLGLCSKVDGIIYSAQAGYKKPQLDFFKFAQEKVGYIPDELLLIDDTLENVIGAQNAGWNSVHWDGKRTLLEILDQYK